MLKYKISKLAYHSLYENFSNLFLIFDKLNGILLSYKLSDFSVKKITAFMGAYRKKI